MIKLTLKQAIQLYKTKKDFICFNMDNDKTRITRFTLTNDLARHKKDYQYFKVLSTLKININTLIF